MSEIIRCDWAEASEIERIYHDEEWGVPVTDDKTLFEFLILEGAQAGLSWRTVLQKREAYRKAFFEMGVEKVAQLDEQTCEDLRLSSGIIRNKLKTRAVVKNAQAFLAVQAEFGTFARYIWRFVDGKPIQNCWRSMAEMPAETVEAQRMSRDLKKRGFSFVGPVICYAFMQATGMVNDHLDGCYRRLEIMALASRVDVL